MDKIDITIDGRPLRVPAGTSVAGAIALAGLALYRRSVGGEARGPLCGMGVCAECRVTIDGRPQQLSCLTPCADGMEVVTDALL
ncbi:MAG TPA: (2Fe-2S)-binding protein [Herpetosiphonaceae bacterium]|nr:(2Fe-2S)-binding protein [Herpetosiphonaceae bacterium]